MAKNEELMEGILAAAMGDMDYDQEGGQEDGRVGGGEIEHPNDNNGERLGTIGEDGDEDKQIYDTQNNNNNNHYRGGSEELGDSK
jgi:hypothetical protein